MLDPPPRGVFVSSLPVDSHSSAALRPEHQTLGERSPSWEQIRRQSAPDLFVSPFLLSVPSGKTPVSFVYPRLLLIGVLLVTTEGYVQ